MTDVHAGDTAAKRGMPGWLIAVLIVGGLSVVCGGAALFGAVSILVPRIQQKQQQIRQEQRRIACANNLRQLGYIHADAAIFRGEEPSEGGSRYFVTLVAGAGADPRVLICPADAMASHAAPGAAGGPDDDPATLRARCSYAVRDFARHPLDPEADDEVIAADAGGHHVLGINVLYSSGAVHFRDRDALGLGPDEPIVVGPDSPDPELRKLCIVPVR